MNTANDILSYAQIYNISMIAEGGQLKIDAPKESLTDEFIERAKVHKQEIIKALERWNPELANQGYVWCMDCKFFNGVNCDHADNPFHTVVKCPQVPRLCQWYKT